MAWPAGQDGVGGVSEGQSGVGGDLSTNPSCFGTHDPLTEPAYQNPSVSSEPCHKNNHH